MKHYFSADLIWSACKAVLVAFVSGMEALDDIDQLCEFDRREAE